MSNLSKTTERLITLAWNDVEPKLVAALVSGAAVGFLLSVLAAYGIVLPTPVPEVLELLAVGAAGWIKKTVQKVPVVAPTKVPLPVPAAVADETLPADNS